MFNFHAKILPIKKREKNSAKFSHEKSDLNFDYVLFSVHLSTSCVPFLAIIKNPYSKSKCAFLIGPKHFFAVNIGIYGVNE